MWTEIRCAAQELDLFNRRAARGAGLAGHAAIQNAPIAADAIKEIVFVVAPTQLGSATYDAHESVVERNALAGGHIHCSPPRVQLGEVENVV